MNVHAPNHKSTVETPQRSDSLDTLRQWLSEGGKRKLTEEELVAVKYLLPKSKLKVSVGWDLFVCIWRQISCS